MTEAIQKDLLLNEQKWENALAKAIKKAEKISAATSELARKKYEEILKELCDDAQKQYEQMQDETSRQISLMKKHAQREIAFMEEKKKDIAALSDKLVTRVLKKLSEQE